RERHDMRPDVRKGGMVLGFELRGWFGCATWCVSFFRRPFSWPLTRRRGQENGLRKKARHCTPVHHRDPHRHRPRAPFPFPKNIPIPSQATCQVRLARRLRTLYLKSRERGTMRVKVTMTVTDLNPALANSFSPA